MRRPTVPAPGFPHVMSTAAMFVALSGTATAATALITSSMIKDNTITSADVKNGSLKGIDFAPGQIPTGPAGPVGPAGAKGDAGATGATGVAGPNGATGATGPAGPAGAAGPAGSIGPAGPAGAIGPAGPSGPVGPRGPAGPAGPAAPVDAPKAPVGTLKLSGVDSERPGGAFVVSDIAWTSEADTSWTRGGGASVGAPVVGEITVTKTPDSTSNALWERITLGRSFSAGSVLALSSATAAAPYATFELGTMFVTAIKPRTEDGKAVEEVSLVTNPVREGAATVPSPVLAAGPQPSLDPAVGTLTIDGFGEPRPISLAKLGVVASTTFASGAGASAGRPQPLPITVVKGVDGQSSVLRSMISTGRAAQKATIDVAATSATPRVVYSLTGAFVTEVSLEGAGGSLERVSLVYKTIEIATTSAGKTTRYCWDVPAGTAGRC